MPHCCSGLRSARAGRGVRSGDGGAREVDREVQAILDQLVEAVLVDGVDRHGDVGAELAAGLADHALVDAERGLVGLHRLALGHAVALGREGIAAVGEDVGLVEAIVQLLLLIGRDQTGVQRRQNGRFDRAVELAAQVAPLALVELGAELAGDEGDAANQDGAAGGAGQHMARDDAHAAPVEAQLGLVHDAFSSWLVLPLGSSVCLNGK